MMRLKERLTKLTYFICTINIFYGEYLPQSVEQHFGQGWNQLRCRHQHVNTVFPLGNHVQTLQC